MCSQGEAKSGRAGQPVTGASWLDTGVRELADMLEDEVVVVDGEYRVQFANSAMLTRLAKTAPAMVNRACYEACQGRSAPCGPPLWVCPLPKVLQTGSPATLVHAAEPGGGDDTRKQYVKIVMHPVRDHNGKICAVAEFRRDVTAERELETEILKRHHHLYALSLISGAVSALPDLDTILNLSLDVALEVVGGEIGGILLLDAHNRELSYRVYRGLSARYAEKVRMKLGEGVAGQVAKTGEPILIEDLCHDERVAHRDLVSTEGLKGLASVPLKTKDKVVGVINVASHMPGRFSEDDVYLLNSIGYQIGTAIEQTKLYGRLARAGERYRALLQHALTAQEEERRRIARELHDETSQSMTSLSLSLQAAIGIAEAKGIQDDELMDRLRKAHSTAVHAGNEIVKLMKELRPTLLDEFGMPAAIRRYAKDTLEAHGINVTSEFTGVAERYRPEVEVTLFRVAQGVLGNILQHSEAQNARIEMHCDEDRCLLSIEDDGKGFNVNKLTRVDPSGRGAGLFTMKERVRLVGGFCRVDSRPGRGTRVIVKVPLKRVVGDEEDQGADS